jgi:hypothetical protein
MDIKLFALEREIITHIRGNLMELSNMTLDELLAFSKLENDYVPLFSRYVQKKTNETTIETGKDIDIDDDTSDNYTTFAFQIGRLLSLKKMTPVAAPLPETEQTSPEQSTILCRMSSVWRRVANKKRNSVFQNAYMEQCFKDWRLKEFIITFRISTICLTISTFTHGYFDLLTYCDPMIPAKSPSLCLDWMNGYPVQTLRLAGLGAVCSLTSVLSFSKMSTKTFEILSVTSYAVQGVVTW